jgi:hypothetical protein
MTRLLLVGATTLALLSGCAHSSQPAAAAPMAGAGDEMKAMCPMGVPGTQVSAVDEVNGSTMTFTAHAHVAELQRRVHDMAKMHNQHHAGGDTHEGMHMGGTMGGGREMSGMMMPPSDATVFNLENGASIKLMPINEADLLTLQTAVRMHAQRMQQSGCDMMTGMHHG